MAELWLEGEISYFFWRTRVIDYAEPGVIGCRVKIEGRIGNATIKAGGAVQGEALRTLSTVGQVQGKGIRVENYAANVAGLNSVRLGDMVPTAYITRQGILPCNVKYDGANIIETHGVLVDQYLSSVADPHPPRTLQGGYALSAKTPDYQLVNQGKIFQLVEGQGEKRNLFQMIFKPINMGDLGVVVKLNACPKISEFPTADKCDRKSIQLEIPL